MIKIAAGNNSLKWAIGYLYFTRKKKKANSLSSMAYLGTYCLVQFLAVTPLSAISNI